MSVGNNINGTRNDTLLNHISHEDNGMVTAQAHESLEVSVTNQLLIVSQREEGLSSPTSSQVD